MRLVKHPILLFALCGALGLAACGGDDDDDGDGDGTTDGNTVDPAGEDHTFVVNDVIAPASPAEAELYGLDIDGDDGNTIDNKLGNLLGTLAIAGLDVQAVVREQVAQGGIILLANLKATDLVDASGVGLYVYLGANPDPAPCESEADTVCGRHLQGDGTFDIAPDSPENAFLVGENADGTFVGGPGTVTIQLALAGGAELLTIELDSARAEVSVSDSELTNGKLGGAISVDNINNEIIPAVVSILSDVIAGDPTCTSPAPQCCEDDTTAKLILDFLDEDDDCQVSTEELIANPALSTLLAPDLDLDDEPGEDSISLGVGFSAVTGTFTPPAP